MNRAEKIIEMIVADEESKNSVYLQAKEIAATGDFDKAWDVAKKDPTMNKGVDKKKWIEFVKKNLKK